MPDAAPEPPEAAADRPPPRRAGALLLLLAAALLVLAAAIVYAVHQAGRGGAGLLRDAGAGVANLFRPQVRSATVIRTSLGTLRGQAKLVVLTSDVNIDVEVRDAKAWLGIDWGEASVRMQTTGRVQYYVPLAELTAQDIRLEPEQERVVVRVPAPVLDHEMVHLELDPARVRIRKDADWLRLDRVYDRTLEDQARAHLRRAALAEGGHELLRQRARVQGRAEIRRLLQPLAEALRPGVELRVDFEPPAEPVAEPHPSPAEETQP